jgi:hypothetical protein
MVSFVHVHKIQYISFSVRNQYINQIYDFLVFNIASIIFALYELDSFKQIIIKNLLESV